MELNFHNKKKQKIRPCGVIVLYEKKFTQKKNNKYIYNTAIAAQPDDFFMV